MGSTDIKVGREFMLEVYVRHLDPVVASEIANRFPQIYQEFNANRIREHMEAVRDAAARELTAIDQWQGELRSREGAGTQSRASPDPEGSAFLEGSTDERLRALADRFRNVLAEASAQALRPSAPLVVVQRAVPPTRPVFPLPLLNAIVAALTGLVFGCYYALFCGMLARARRQRIRRQLEMPSLSQEELKDLQDRMIYEQDSRA